MTNPDRRTTLLRRLVSAARAVVTYEVSLPRGCSRICNVLFWLRQLEPLDYPVFAEYDRATRHLPRGAERLHWEREALRERDIRLEEINATFRDRVFAACWDIIDRFQTI